MEITSTMMNLANKRGKDNQSIIRLALEAFEIDFEYDGTNLKTYAAWKAAGYQVQKGQKALLQVELWTPCKFKEKDKDDKEKKGTKMFLKKSSLFTIDQVKKIDKEVA